MCEQKESEALHKREVQLRERERALRDAEKLSHTTDIIIDKVVTQEVENRCQAVTEVKFFSWLHVNVNGWFEYHLWFYDKLSCTSNLIGSCLWSDGQMTLPLTLNSDKWPRQNFSLWYQYNIKQTSDENKEKYQLEDY